MTNQLKTMSVSQFPSFLRPGVKNWQTASFPVSQQP